MHVAVRDHLDFLVARAMKREDALDSDAIGDLAHDKGRADLATSLADHHSFEGLHPLLVALFHLPVDAHGVAGSKIGNVLAHLLGLNVFNWAAAHDRNSHSFARRGWLIIKA